MTRSNVFDPTLTLEEVQALADYAQSHGPNWKDSLRTDWQYARAPVVLLMLRNSERFGPRGLIRFTFDSYKKGSFHGSL